MYAAVQSDCSAHLQAIMGIVFLSLRILKREGREGDWLTG